MLITLDDGSIGVVSNTRTNARGYDVRLEVHGVMDAVAAGLDEGLPLRPTQPGITWPAGPPHTFFMDRLTEAFRRELATFCAVAAGEVAVAVHHRGRHGHRLDRRGRHAVGPARAARCASTRSRARPASRRE